MLHFQILYLPCSVCFFNHLECECDEEGSVDNTCTETDGKCTCKEHIIGEKCAECEEEFFGFPNCEGMYICNLNLNAK